jgi:tetratricopeptide (TPR) repeat protein
MPRLRHATLNLAFSILLTGGLASPVFATADIAAPAGPPSPLGDLSSYSNAQKARELVDAAINMTDSNRAVGLLWQATDLDPNLVEAYQYLALYYNSRSQFDQVVKVYQKLVKYQPNQSTAWLNIGEAYLSVSPPQFDKALPYFLKGYRLDSTSTFAALRIGEIYAQELNRAQALKYLRIAAADRAKNPDIAKQANELISRLGS